MDNGEPHVGSLLVKVLVILSVPQPFYFTLIPCQPPPHPTPSPFSTFPDPFCAIGI